MAEWFKEWFNSAEYLEIYKHRDNEDANKLIKLILSNISISKKAKILDAACGSGRHSILLAAMGYKVTGFDLSEPLLELAINDAEEKKLDIQFIHADIREVKFPGNFNLILNLFTSFGYFETDDENFKFIRNSRKWIKAGGHFVLDYFNSDYLINNLVPQSIKVSEHKKIIENRRLTGDRVEKDIYIESFDKKYKFSESVKIYDKDKIIMNFEDAGYTLNNLFGSYDGDKFDHKNSERLIAVFQK